MGPEVVPETQLSQPLEDDAQNDVNHAEPDAEQPPLAVVLRVVRHGLLELGLRLVQGRGRFLEQFFVLVKGCVLVQGVFM